MTSLSNNTEALLQNVENIQNKAEIEDTDTIDVSKAVSFFALTYEKFRNVIEFKDDHIIRRHAINRIIHRRLAFNPTLNDEAASIAKEIAWAGYYNKDKIPEQTVDQLQKIIDWYLTLKQELVKGEDWKQVSYYSNFIRDLLVCQIEELFNEKESKLKNAFLIYFYHVYNPVVKIQGLDKAHKDLLYYIANERVFLKSDEVYLRYHLFRLVFEHLLKIKPAEFVEYLPEYKKAFRFIDKNIAKTPNRKIKKMLRNLRPAFLILRELVLQKKDRFQKIAKEEKKLKATVDSVCREKYELSQKKLARAGIRSVIYILLTKMVFIFILEYPVMRYLGESIDYMSLAINSLFPAFLMGLFVVFTGVPDSQNTERIYDRLKQVLYQNQLEPIVFKQKKERKRGLLFSISFWLFYFATFLITFFLINLVLDWLGFHWISKLIFLFFVSAISFFGYRVRKIAKEYAIVEKESIYTPVIDFFMMPLVSVGKWLSSEIARINFLLYFFDFIIEAPFKVLFEVIEEWIHFIRRRKEDIE